MKIYCLLSRTWSDFFKSPDLSLNDPTSSNDTFNEISAYPFSPSSDKVWIFGCYFHQLTYSSNGAAILYKTQEGHILTEYSQFSECQSNSYGGAILVDYADCVISHVYCSGCSAMMASFLFVGFKYTPSINWNLDSSVSKCHASRSYTMINVYGTINVQSVNCSDNDANKIAGISCITPQTIAENEFGATICYSLFSKNTATTCIAFESPGNFKMECSNVISNRGIETIYAMSLVIINSCSILGNGEPTFSAANSQTKFILTNCYIDNCNANSDYALELIDQRKTFPSCGAITNNKIVDKDRNLVLIWVLSTPFLSSPK